MKHLMVMAFALVACKGSSDSGPTVVAMPNLGLKVTAPMEMKATDEEIPADMGKSYSLWSRAAGVEVHIKLETFAMTPDMAKDMARMFKPTDLKVESLSDGFALSYKFENYDKIKTQMHVYRTIAGKPTDCSFMAENAQELTTFTQACKTLAPA